MLAAVNFWRRWPHSAGHQEKVDSFIQWENLRHQDCHQKPDDCKDAHSNEIGAIKRVKYVRDAPAGRPARLGCDSSFFRVFAFVAFNVAPKLLSRHWRPA